MKTTLSPLTLNTPAKATARELVGGIIREIERMAVSWAHWSCVTRGACPQLERLWAELGFPQGSSFI